MLSVENDEALFRSLAGRDARQQEQVIELLVERYTPLVRWLSSRYAGRGVDAEELRQIGFLGLMKAINRFDPDRGVEFVAFARPTVQGEIQRHFRDKRRWIQLPRRLQEMKAKLRGATEKLTHQLGRAPTVGELATHLGVDEELVLEALTAEDTFSLISLDAEFDGTRGNSSHNAFGVEESRFDLALDLASLRPLIAALPARKRTILELRFFADMTQSEIAQRVGVSQMHISRLLAETFRDLRDQLAEPHPEEARRSA